MAEQPENIVIEHLRRLRGDIGDIKGEMQTLKTEIQSQRPEMATKSDLHSLRADVASDMLTMQKDTREQIVGLRRAVIEYHSAVVGHGLIISELEERVADWSTILNCRRWSAAEALFLADREGSEQ